MFADFFEAKYFEGKNICFSLKLLGEASMNLQYFAIELSDRIVKERDVNDNNELGAKLLCNRISLNEWKTNFVVKLYDTWAREFDESEINFQNYWFF